MAEKKNPFEFHTDFEYQISGDQGIGQCPFPDCEKEDHFYYNTDTFLWDCKVCGRHGNLLSFLRQFHEANKDVESARIVAELRKLPIVQVKEHGIKLNRLNGSYLIPTYKYGQINNLYKACLLTDYETGKQYWSIRATTTMPQTLMNVPEVIREKVWVVEGHWDDIAGDIIIQGKGNITILSPPGANVWNPEWCEYLDNRDVIFCYDNDEAGKNGFQAVILKHIANSQFKPTSVSFIDWGDKKSGYDLDDCRKEYGVLAYEWIQERIVPYATPPGSVVVKQKVENVPEDLSCDTFEKVLTEMRKLYYTTSDMELGLLFILSSIFSIKIEGEQVWGRLIGPPGSGKTTLAKMVSASSQVEVISTFTGLFSGYDTGDGKDNSLVPIISGKTLIVKDADALLKQHDIERIMSELRDFYDKDSKVHYRTGMNFDYQNTRSTIILCGTNVLRRADSSFLGERFLDFELRLTPEDERNIGRMMLRKSLDVAYDNVQSRPEIPLMAALKGFITHLMKKDVTMRLSEEQEEIIFSHAIFAAKMRSKVDRDKYTKEMTFNPTSEVPSRLIGQLSKLCVCAPVVLGDTTFSSMTTKLLSKVTKDIIDPSSTRYRMCSFLAEDWLTVSQLARVLSVSEKIAYRELNDLAALKLIRGKLNKTGSVGAPAQVFTLTDQMRQGMRAVESS